MEKMNSKSTNNIRFLINILTEVYKIWQKATNFISTIISKIVMAILFYTIFTSISIVLRILNKDLLSKKIDKNIDTYWINREQQPQSLINQF